MQFQKRKSPGRLILITTGIVTLPALVAGPLYWLGFWIVLALPLLVLAGIIRFVQDLSKAQRSGTRAPRQAMQPQATTLQLGTQAKADLKQAEGLAKLIDDDAEREAFLAEAHRKFRQRMAGFLR